MVRSLRTRSEHIPNYVVTVEDVDGVVWWYAGQWARSSFVQDKARAHWWFRPSGGRSATDTAGAAFMLACRQFGEGAWAMILTDRIGARRWFWCDGWRTWSELLELLDLGPDELVSGDWSSVARH